MSGVDWNGLIPWIRAEQVADQAEALGIPLEPWQRRILPGLMDERPGYLDRHSRWRRRDA